MMAREEPASTSKLISSSTDRVLPALVYVFLTCSVLNIVFIEPFSIPIYPILPSRLKAFLFNSP
jgi:hypothetical protein